jgi:hypothetical protein
VARRPLGFSSLPCYRLGPARGSPCQEAGWAGWERKNVLQQRKGKEGTAKEQGREVKSCM